MTISDQIGELIAKNLLVLFFEGVSGEMFGCSGQLMFTRSEWPWPWNGACIWDQEKDQCLYLVMVLCLAVSRDIYKLADSPGLQEPSW